VQARIAELQAAVSDRTVAATGDCSEHFHRAQGCP
jgi:hypothetical protein